MSDLYNIALIPTDETIIQELEQYSQELAKKNHGPYILGVNSIPHVTIGILNSTDNTIFELWQIIKSSNISNLHLALRGLYFQYWGDSIWHGLQVNKIKELKTLQANMLKIDLVEGFKNLTGSEYFPHFTLGATPKDTFSLKDYRLDYKLIKLENIECKLCIGKTGPQYQLEEILYE